MVVIQRSGSLVPFSIGVKTTMYPQYHMFAYGEKNNMNMAESDEWWLYSALVH